jgi:CBS domain containing-hemolysin-like protein
MLVLILIIAMVFSFLLSGMESAVLSVSRVRVRHAAEDDDHRAARLLPLLADRESLLGAVTVANHAANVTAFGLIIWELVKVLGHWGYAVGFLLALPVFIVVLELLPKTLFRRFPFRALRRLAPLLNVIGWFRWPFRAISHLPALPDDDGEQSYGSRDEMKRLIVSMSAEKLLPASAARLMERVLDYRRFTARAVMVPLAEIVAVSPDMSASMAAQIARQHHFSALLVLDAKGGFSSIFEASALPPNLPEDRLVRQHMRPVDEVSMNLSALAVLQRLRRRGRSLALVVDPSKENHAVGLVTEEDLIKPLL